MSLRTWSKPTRQALSTSGSEQREWMNGYIPQNPVREDNPQQRPDEYGPDENVSQRAPCDRERGTRHEEVPDKRHRDHHQGIQPERGRQMSAHELVKGPQASAPRTVATGEPVKRARRVKRRSARVEQIDETKGTDRQQHESRRLEPLTRRGSSQPYAPPLDPRAAKTTDTSTPTTINTSPVPKEIQAHILAFLELSRAPARSPASSLPLTCAA
jgi:hypothetical protein